MLLFFTSELQTHSLSSFCSLFAIAIDEHVDNLADCTVPENLLKMHIDYFKKMETLKATTETEFLKRNWEIARNGKIEWTRWYNRLFAESLSNPTGTCEYKLPIKYTTEMVELLEAKRRNVTAINKIAHYCMAVAPKIAVIFLQRALNKLNTILKDLSDNVYLKKAEFDINNIRFPVYDFIENVSVEWVRHS